jgi:hypothetical protein
MNSISKELKWALCGFLGGFVLCYVLVGALKAPAHSQASMAHAQLTSVQTKPIWIQIDKSTSAQKSILVDDALIRLNPLQRSPILKNVPAGTLPASYSVDLFDGRKQR